MAKVNPKAIAANEKLLAFFDMNAIKLDKQQFAIMAKLRTGAITNDQATDALIASGLKLSGAAGKHMTEAIATAIGSDDKYIKYAPVKKGLMSHRAKQIVAGGSGLISTASKDLALEQVRATIVKKSPNAQGYIRVANAGACDFCASLDGVRVNSDAIDVHNGCGCTVIPINP